MPTYQYQCKKCGHTFEELQSMSEAPLIRCPNCHTDNLARAVGTGTGLIFKGSGFYQTDYKKHGGKPRGKSGKQSGTTDKGGTAKDSTQE